MYLQLIFYDWCSETSINYIDIMDVFIYEKDDETE